MSDINPQNLPTLRAENNEIFFKHAKKFYGKGADPALTFGTNYGPDGILQVCNPRIGLRVKGTHAMSPGITIHNKTTEQIPGIYPNLERLLAASFPEKLQTLFVSAENIALWLRQAESAYQVAKRIRKLSLVELRTTQTGSVTLNVVEDGVFYQGTLPAAGVFRNEARTFNAEFLVHVLQVYADAARDFSVELAAPMDPLVFRDSTHTIEALFMPFRVPDPAPPLKKTTGQHFGAIE